MYRSRLSYNLVALLLIALMVAGAWAQTSRSPDVSDLTVDRFQVDPFRLRDGARINCWLRNTAWAPLEGVDVELEVKGESGETRSYPFARISKVPAGRVIELRTKIRDVAEPRNYRLLVRGTGSGNSKQRMIEVDPTRSRSGPNPLQGTTIGGVGGGQTKTGYPKEVDLQLASAFSNENRLELGHISIWRTDEQELEIQGGLRNGLDRGVESTRITFSMTDRTGKTIERNMTIDQDLQPGEIYGFSQSLSGVDELSSVSYSLSYQTGSSETTPVSMSWNDVRDELRPPTKNPGSVDSGSSSNAHPLLSLQGITKVSGRLDGREGRMAVYLLKGQMTHRSSAVRPEGKVQYKVLRGGNVQLSKGFPLRADAFRPMPNEPEVGDVRPGMVYWDADGKMFYVALFATGGIQTPSALRVRFKIRDAGIWTFDRLEPPYMNGPIPPDHVRGR